MEKKPGRQITTSDWAIKTVLRDKADFDVLEGFLTALFKRPVVILDLLESEGNRTDEADKYNHVDLLAKTEDGKHILVEVQYLSEMAYLKRLTYGTAKTLVESLRLGELSLTPGSRRSTPSASSISTSARMVMTTSTMARPNSRACIPTTP